MFTGIINDLGSVGGIERRPGLRLTIRCLFPAESLILGASIACNGVCLTVADKSQDAAGTFFVIDASEETVRLTTLGEWEIGRPIHLERALKLGDELGGHLVSGHIDGVAVIEERFERDGSVEFALAAPAALLPLIAPKGSVALDGTSLTVTWADRERFGLALIPHTMAVTHWGQIKIGDRLNLEVDPLARYVARMREFGV